MADSRLRKRSRQEFLESAQLEYGASWRDAHLDGFTYGIVNPLLAAAAIGCGIWTMHFIAMLGFSVTGSTIVYDVPLTLFSLLLAIVVVGIAVFAATAALWMTLNVQGLPSTFAAALMAGVAVVAMRYTAMAAVTASGAAPTWPPPRSRRSGR